MTPGRRSFDDELARLFDLSHDAFCIAGFDGYLKRANPAFPRLLGCSLDELLAVPFVENVYPGDRESVKAALAELAAGNAVVGFECRHVCADGSVRWFEWSGSSWPEAGVMYAVGRDVTDRRVANDELGALRRVATLAAQGVAPSDLFAVVAEEVARVIDVPRVGVARYEPDGTATTYSGFPPLDPVSAVGQRWSLDGTSVLAQVRRSRETARIDDYSQLGGELAATMRRLGIASAVGVPIVVAGRLWGAMAVFSSERDPLPDDTAARLASFTELLATTIANAESREALGQLAEQQAALRRVATLVARAVSPSAVFAAVADEMARCLHVVHATVSRYDGDTFVPLAVYHRDRLWKLPEGLRLAMDGDNVGVRVFRTGGVARMDGHDDAAGSHAARIRELGIRSAVGVPIMVDGILWGAAVVGSSAPEPLPPDTEARIGDFAELVATAIANAATRAALQASRDELSVLAEQQAALRRVATLVARGTSPPEVFSTVADEMARCLHAGNASVNSFENDMVTVVAVAAVARGIKRAPLVGERHNLLDGDNIATRVFHTGRPARLEGVEFQSAPGFIAARLRKMGLRSTVGVPIIVDGRVWGMAALGWLRPEPLPTDTEARMSDFADLVATAIANAATRAELIASRARIVAAADEGRRRLERDLHDGAQQRLVALGLQLHLTEASVPADLQALGEQLGDIASGLTGVTVELQEISRGIHPAILSKGGIGPALKTLARRSAVPVTLELAIDRRLPDSVEVGAYYVVSEALTNAAKHSRASHVAVRGQAKDDVLSLSISDDGIGGADFARGSGLIGLKDRVEALGGRLRIVSPAGRGTSLDATIPLDSP
jgi:PAS domain S-box-containing protein